MELSELGFDEHFQNEAQGHEGIIGRVFRTQRADSVSVHTANGDITARIPGRLRDPKVHSGAELPAIGDWVLLEQLEVGFGIKEVLPRKNHLCRKVAGKEFKEQVVGANIDIIFIVMGLDDDHNLRRLERYLYMVASSGSKPVVILNKSDLAMDLQRKGREVMEIASDVDVHQISALKGEGLDIIREYLEKGITISLVGSSGVGKSTLINALMDEDVQDTGKVRQSDSKGRHVTSSRELFVLPGGGIIIDNPGIREIQLWGDSADLSKVFTDIDELAKGCKFKDCEHISEPNCAVKKALEEGTFSQERYDNYIKMKKELAHLQQKADLGTQGAERAKWKDIKKYSRSLKKSRKGR